MNDTVLSMDGITKVYNGQKVLDNVSINIKRGEIYGLVGNNGAGKTTLMRIISGQTFKDKGKINFLGSSLEEDIRNKRNRMGVLIEEPGFFGNMTAFENLEYFRIQFGIPGKDVVNEILNDVGLGNVGKKKCKDFSIGMKQRLGIAIALLNNPEFLMLDEPINGLDPAGIIEFRNILISINKKRNTTILISSHILAEMSNIATKYGFLSRGKLMEELPAKELEKKCENYIDIVVRDVKRMCVALEKEFDYHNYKVYPDNHIHLYEGIDKGEEICELAVNMQVGLSSIEKKTVNLENYYMNMVEGI